MLDVGRIIYDRSIIGRLCKGAQLFHRCIPEWTIVARLQYKEAVVGALINPRKTGTRK